MIWNDTNIRKFLHWRRIENKITAAPFDVYSDFLNGKRLSLFAQLSIQNLEVICLINDEIIGVEKFNSAMKLQGKYIESGQIMFFYPVNFRNNLEQFNELYETIAFH